MRQRSAIMIIMIIEEIRKQIKTSGKSLSQIGRDTGVDKAALSRIMNGGSCKVETVDILLKYFKFEIKPKYIKANFVNKIQKNIDVELAKYHRQSWTLYAEPYFWKLKAEALYEAANSFREKYWPTVRKPRDLDAAYSDFMRGDTYMLIAGLAVEALIKGLIIGKKPELVKSQKLSKKLTNHNLVELYQTAELRNNCSRNNLLLRLQNYVENFGRYPVTKIKRDMEKKTKTRFAGEADFHKIDRLWDFLISAIKPYIQDVDEKEGEL